MNRMAEERVLPLPPNYTAANLPYYLLPRPPHLQLNSKENVDKVSIYIGLQYDLKQYEKDLKRAEAKVNKLREQLQEMEKDPFIKLYVARMEKKERSVATEPTGATTSTLFPGMKAGAARSRRNKRGIRKTRRGTKGRRYH